MTQLSDIIDRLTEARLLVVKSATFYPPSAWVVSATGSRTGHERNAWKANCSYLVDQGLLRPNAHDDFYLTDLGEQVREAASKAPADGGENG